MSRRLLLLGLGFALALLAVYPSARGEGLNLFYWLLAGLVACVVLLWPSNARVQREELRQERMSWADRVPISAPPPAEADNADRPLALRSARSRARGRG